MISFPFWPLKHTRVIYYIYASKTQKNKLKINCRPWCTTLCSGNQAMSVLSPHWLAKQNRVFLNKNTPHITEPSELTALWACTQQWKSFFLLCCLHFLWHTMGRVLLWHAKGRVLLWNEGSSPLVKRRVKSSCETKGQVFLWHMKGWESSCETRWVESSCDTERVESCNI